MKKLMQSLLKSTPLFLFAVLAFAPSVFGASITFITVDGATKDAWRTTDVPKPDIDWDNVYGTDGYLIAQYGATGGNPLNTKQPSYGTIAVVAG